MTVYQFVFAPDHRLDVFAPGNVDHSLSVGLSRLITGTSRHNEGV